MSFALSLLYAFLMLLLPLAEALYHGRSPGALLYLYWVESFALLILHPIRIFLHQRWTNATGHRYATMEASPTAKLKGRAKPISATASPFTYLKSFSLVIGIFTLAHGVFILLLVFLFKVGGSVPLNDIRAATMWGAGVPLAMFIVDLFASVDVYAFAKHSRCSWCALDRDSVWHHRRYVRVCIDKIAVGNVCDFFRVSRVD
jgi:hypothetical protein